MFAKDVTWGASGSGCPSMVARRTRRLVVLVPIKPSEDRGTYEGVISRLGRGFGPSNLVLGLDEDDRVGACVAKSRGVSFVTEAPASPFPVCRLWMRMAEYACESLSATCTLLLGDDVECRDAPAMLAEVDALMERGFQCVAVRERLHPSWPTFLALESRAFVTPFFRRSLCTFFVNQEADPCIYECFRRCGTACFTRTTYLTNATGGVEGGLSPFNPPRYERVSVPWKAELLPLWKAHEAPPHEESAVVTVDVCVPMYRVNAGFVRALLDLDTPAKCDVRFCVCLDSPPSDAQRRELADLEASDARLRVRVNPANMGASGTRNRLMDESHSDWLLFLDDDVVPAREILVEYCRAIREHPTSRGFVGLSEIPRDGRLWTDAIHVSTLYFWHIALHTREPVAWGVTANLLVRWDPYTRFDPRFPKTGGGEDIDFCIQMGHSLVPVPGARVTHPWRDTPAGMFRRLFEWAVGDGMINVKHPGLTYRTLPSAVELLLLWPLVSPRTVWAVLAAEAAAQLTAELVLHPFFHGRLSHAILREASWPRRLSVALFAGLSRNTSDAGRLYGQLKRGEFNHITTRFDWFIGRSPSLKRFEWARTLALYGALYALLCALHGGALPLFT